MEDLVSSLTFMKLLEISERLIIEQMSAPINSDIIVPQEEGHEVMTMGVAPSLTTILRSPKPNKLAPKEK